MTQVFHDRFRVETDTDIAAYPSGTPDYAYTNGGTGALTVKANQAKVVDDAAIGWYAVRLIRSGMPTGAQKATIRGIVDASTANSRAGVCCRMAAATEDFYVAWFGPGDGIDCKLYRVDAGVFVQLAVTDLGLTGNGPHLISLRATGTNPVVLRTWVNGSVVSALDFSDSDANRKTSGVPGFFRNIDFAGTQITLSDFAVSDLVPTGLLVTAA